MFYILILRNLFIRHFNFKLFATFIQRKLFSFTKFFLMTEINVLIKQLNENFGVKKKY